MNELARRLSNLRTGQQQTDRTPTAIFGTAAQISRNLDDRERVRIGMWPAISAEEPETAMGLMTVLGFLLSRWPDIRVYRLFAKLEGDPQDYAWSAAQSQFSVDDWEIEPLDENVAVWGKLAKEGGEWVFTVEVENDLGERINDEFTYRAESLAGLVNLLPAASGDIAESVESDEPLIEAYDDEVEASDADLRSLLKGLFEWQVNLLLSLWGKDWPEAEIEAALNGLAEAGKALDDPFGHWAVTNAAAHAMQPGYQQSSAVLVDYVGGIIEYFPDSSFPAIYLSNALHRLGAVDKAHAMLQADMEAHPKSVDTRVTLGRLYTLSGRLRDALGVYQQAIEDDVVNTTLYNRYARLMATLERNDFNVNEFVLIDPDEYDDDLMIWEAIEAYAEALIFDPDRPDILEQKLLHLIDIGAEDELWADFETLVEMDEDGTHVRNVADMLYDVDDPQPAIEVLKKQIEKTPDRPDLHINLAVAYINAEEEDLALETLDKADEVTDGEDDATFMDIDRLTVMAEDPDFEARMGEITATVDAGNSIPVGDADFLEDVIERAPKIGEAYVALGKTYLIWGESDDALETLMDGHEELPEDPDIIEALAGILWESGQRELAFDYLNKGIAANPNHVPLLALTGQYLFEDDQEDAARAYLNHAEGIAPRHPALSEARENIAENIAKRK